MPQADITLYAYTFPSRAERVLCTLKELGLGFTLQRLDPFKGETATAQFLNLSPSGKIPVLVHGEKVLSESLAIMEYLNALAGGNLVPQELDELYRFRHLLHYILTEVEAYLWIADQASRLKGLYHWPSGTTGEAIARVRKNIVRVFELVSQHDYAVGNNFSLADIYVFSIMRWARSYDIAMPDAVCGYLKRLEARPAFQP